MMLAFGLGFEFPVLLTFLQLARVLHWRQLARFRRYALVLVFVVNAVITPSGDPVTLLALSVPMVVFYEISILIGRFVFKPSDGAGPGRRPGHDFELDDYQRRAIAAIDEGQSVLVAAPDRLGQDGRGRARHRRRPPHREARRSTRHRSRPCRTRSTPTWCASTAPRTSAC
jgi:hypothetical protein